MSGAMENRAAVFTSSPQDVEVYRAGVWEPGSMLGWRHEPDGSCRAWIRLAAGGAEGVWIGLAHVRLPEPLALRNVDDTRVPRVGGRPGTGSGGSRRAAADAPSEPTAGMNLFGVRDAGRAQPPDRATAAPRPGGRRRAPEPAEVEASAAYWAAFEAASRGADTPSTPGRHRAPAAGGTGAGRHRAADTEMMPAIGATDRAPAPEESPAAGLPRAAAHDEPDLHTRPMRLATPIPQPRAAAWGSVGGC